MSFREYLKENLNKYDLNKSEKPKSGIWIGVQVITQDGEIVTNGKN